jgi:1,4-dihydroxy-2-naphthoate octaprenyltransferase
MIANVLFLNEVPDIEADSAGGRRNLATLLGRRRAVKLYAILETVAVLWIPFSVVLRLTPIATLLALVSLPFAVRAISGSLRQNENLDKLIPALGANIATAYLTISLLTVGYIISGFLAI